jgi:C-terminal processing protease CtpA/Prc
MKNLIPFFLMIELTAICNTSFSFQASSQSSLIKNGDFAEWTDGKPTDWKISVGATSNNGKSPASVIEKGDGPSLQLSGNKKTEVWNFVGQMVPLEKNKTYMFAATARAENVRREGRQFDNCYVGIFLQRSDGRRMGQKIANISTGKYHQHVLSFKTWGDVSLGQVAIFLSKSGQLNVKDVILKEVTLADSFDLLVADMDRNYSFFVHRNINWTGISDQYRERAQAANTPDEFVSVISEMLAELNDIHVWIVNNGKKIDVAKSSFIPNYDFSLVDNDLKSKKQIGNFGLVGLTSDGFGYVRITSLAGINKKSVDLMKREIENLFDAPGIILDLRRNRGGAEPVAAEIAGMFVEKPVVYARQKFRSGPDHDDFFETQPRVLNPGKGAKYTSPVLCLIGRGAISSGEGFAAMMKAIPHCTTIGKPTRGASGNPQPVHLADGIDVYYSRWMSLTADGSPIENVGIKPDEDIDHRRGSEKTYDRVVQILKEKT